MGRIEPREDESVERLKTFHPISDPIGISGPPQSRVDTGWNHMRCIYSLSVTLDSSRGSI